MASQPLVSSEAAGSLPSFEPLPPLLSGLRVIEDAMGVVAPYAGRILAELGAEVVKIEPPAGDPARRKGTGSSGFSGLFEHLNAGKRSVAIDTSKPSGQSIYSQLLQSAECVVADELSLVLREPHLIESLSPHAAVIAITPFGLTGPRKGQRAGPYGLFHAGGEGNTTPRGGDLRREPVAPTGNLACLDAGVIGAFAVLLFVLHGDLAVEKNPAAGPYVFDVSNLEVLMGLGRQDLCAYPNEGRLENREVKAGPLATLTMRCSDGEVISSLGEQQWPTWCDLSGRPNLQSDPRFETQYLRSAHVAELATELEGWTSHYTRAELELLLQPLGIPLAGVLTPAEVLASPQLRFRHFFHEWNDASPPRRIPSSLPFICEDGRRWQTPGQAPSLGEYTGSLLRENGFNDDQQAILRRAGVIA